MSFSRVLLCQRTFVINKQKSSITEYKKVLYSEIVVPLEWKFMQKNLKCNGRHVSFMLTNNNVGLLQILEPSNLSAYSVNS